MTGLQDLAARFHGSPWHGSPEDTFEFFSPQLAQRFVNVLRSAGYAFRTEDDGLAVVVPGERSSTAAGEERSERP